MSATLDAVGGAAKLAPELRAGARVTRNEAFAVAGALLFVHALLFFRGLPLPHFDAYFFTEPALYLAKEGRLLAPSAEYLDLTYALNFGAYPPLYFVLLAGWFRLFEYGPESLLGFTHVLHILYLGTAWALARIRFGSTRFDAALVVLSCFPFFTHGRPDVLAGWLGTAAFLALPDSPSLRRSALTVILLALTLAASPALGLSAIAGVAAWLAFRSGRLTFEAARRAVVVGAAGALGGLAFWALVLFWQDSLWIAPSQFRVNSSTRGRQLNSLPGLSELFSPYFIAFVYVPLVFATVLPAVLALVRRKDGDRAPSLPLAAIAYLFALLPLALINKRQLLYQHHFALAARLPLHSSLLGSGRRFRLLGILAVLGFTASQVFLQKETLVYAFTGDLRYETLDPAKLAGVRTLAVDSNNAHAFFGRFPGVLIDYDIIKFNTWRDYRAKTKPEILARLPDRLRNGPAVPDAIVLTTRGHFQVGAPNPDVYEKVSGPPLTTVDFLGLPLRQPQTPMALHVYRRRQGVPIPHQL